MTPYDTALRVQRREVDTIKLSISVEVDRAATLEAQRSDHDQVTRREHALAVALPFPHDAWAARMRVDGARLDEAARAAASRLTALRAQAAEAYGTVRAIEIAADAYRDEQERSVANAEQALADDLAAAALLRTRRKQRGFA